MINSEHQAIKTVLFGKTVVGYSFKSKNPEAALRKIQKMEQREYNDLTKS